MITEVSESDVIAYMRMLIELNFKNNSLIPKRQAVINFFRYWRRKGYAVMDHELVPGVRREFRMPDVATEEDFRTVINSIPTGTNDALHIRNRAILLFLEATGCRNGEMCALDVDDLDFANRKVMISTEKNRGSKPFREVFWVGNDETQKALQNWLRKRSEMQKHIPFKDPEAMFVGGRGWQTGKRLTTGAVCIAMRKLSRRAGLPFTLHPHMLRHKFGHDLNNQGANGFTISDLMGHSAVNSTQIYTVMNNREARDAYTRYKSKYLSKSNQRRKV
jgi:integrase/recombinase XerC